MRVIFLALIGYLLFRFFVRFLFPIIKMVSSTKRDLNSMKQRMEQQQQQQGNMTKQTPPKEVEGEYIDFEEIK